MACQGRGGEKTREDNVRKIYVWGAKFCMGIQVGGMDKQYIGILCKGLVVLHMYYTLNKHKNSDWWAYSVVSLGSVSIWASGTRDGCFAASVRALCLSEALLWGGQHVLEPYRPCACSGLGSQYLNCQQLNLVTLGR